MAIHRINNALVCVAPFLASGAGATGLTVSVKIYEIPMAAGSPSLIVNGGSAIEIDLGGYYYRLALSDVDANALYAFCFYTSGTADQKVIWQGWSVGMGWTENLDQAVTAAVAAMLAKLPAALVSGRIDASVGAMATDTLTATALATSAVSEIQSGLALEASVQSVKTKTDQLTFTTANKVDASIQAAGDFAQAAADKVWSSAARTLTSFGAVVADVATAVWAAASRTLTSIDLSSLGGVTVEVLSPVLEGGDLEFVQGDAYDVDHGRKVDIVLEGAPTLVGATVKLVINRVLEKSGTVLNAGTDEQTCRFELLAADTALFRRHGLAAYQYQVQATWSGDTPSQPAVLVDGDVNILDRYSAS